jgi:CheY-like chemotaxis protein
MKRALVVEDNGQSMYLLSFILTKGGYEVIEATTGAAGVYHGEHRRLRLRPPGRRLNELRLPLPALRGTAWVHLTC